MQKNLDFIYDENSSKILKNDNFADFLCGMCDVKFETENERNEHRDTGHPDMYFVDTMEQYVEYK